MDKKNSVGYKYNRSSRRIEKTRTTTSNRSQSRFQSHLKREEKIAFCKNSNFFYFDVSPTQEASRLSGRRRNAVQQPSSLNRLKF